MEKRGKDGGVESGKSPKLHEKVGRANGRG